MICEVEVPQNDALINIPKKKKKLTIEALDMMWYPPKNTSIEQGHSHGQY